ncbi:hypothetical protein [Planctomyces sp. SH-PL62]|uniref:baeRF3 domain-containing protein n=1 Tax=Planctomyces sp. SH-PL62 TaxID=1636152 RepID=UPI00078E6145|nr:hypothetical protein [Planctomyces sp. SH-PL62]AMV37310.1 hypothetical protein VT85_07745 [Planctomyces sp. SH-PL62]
MDSLDNDYTAGVFLDTQEAPCLSLYQPTHRSHPDNQQDPIRFRNLLRSLEDSLKREPAAKDVQALLNPFRKLAEDADFWNRTNEGLVALGAPGLFRVYRLQRPVRELAVVAESFHIKPLLRILQSADRYHVLGLSRQGVQLFEGNRDALDPVQLSPDAERGISEAVSTDKKEPHVQVWTFGAGPGPAGVRHGHASAADVADQDAERIFRAVDRAILENETRPSGLPLLLVALPENQALFRRISRNPLLIDQGIEINSDALSIEELRDRAWKAVEPYYLARLARLVDLFGLAQSRDLGGADLAQVMRAAVAGRVATLLIEADRKVPGRVDPATGAIEFHDLADPTVDDLLDDLGELVLKYGGQVLVVPSDRMPTRSGLAAIYRA